MGRNLTENEHLLIIELADDWSKDTKPASPNPTTQQEIEARAEGFDQAFKAILKTVTLTTSD